MRVGKLLLLTMLVGVAATRTIFCGGGGLSPGPRHLFLVLC